MAVLKPVITSHAGHFDIEYPCCSSVVTLNLPTRELAESIVQLHTHVEGNHHHRVTGL